MKPNLTLLFGVRYEYFSPFSEKYGRAANLDIAPGFTNVAQVTPSTAGLYTGQFPSGLIDPDRNNWSPRVALAWKVKGRRRGELTARQPAGRGGMGSGCCSAIAGD